MAVGDQNTVKIGQCLDRRMWGPKRQGRTPGGVQHPAGHHDHDPGRDLDVHDLT